MKYYTYTNEAATVAVTVVTDGIGDPQRQTILAVRYGGLDAAVAGKLGLTPKALAPVAVHTQYLIDLSVEANLTLRVRENVKPYELVFAAVGVSTTVGNVTTTAAPVTKIPDGSVNTPGTYGVGGNADGDNDDNSGNKANGDQLKGTKGLGEQESAKPAAPIGQ